MASSGDDTESSIQMNDLDKLQYKLKGLLFVKVENLHDCFNLQNSFGGWRPDLLIDKLSVREEKLLICSTCHGIMRDAVFYGKASTCKVCVNVEGCDSAFDYDTTRDNINELQLKCPLTEVGCDWTGAIETLTTHFSSCLYYPVPCPLECTVIDNNTAEPVIATLPRHVVESHVTKTCPNKEINCNYCDASVKSVEMNFHVSECEEFLLACPNNCINSHNNEPTLVKRGEMHNHIEIECTNVELDCPFQSNGCTVGKILRKNLATHEQDSMLQHLTLMSLNFKQKLDEKDNKILELQQQIDVLNSKAEEQHKFCNTKMELLQFSMDMHSLDLNSTLKEQDTKIANISEQCIKQYSFSHEWTILNVRDHIRERSELISQPFFAYQYKFTSQLNFRQETNDSLGIYVSIAIGQYDNCLRWPFSGTYRFILVNQDDSTRNYVQEVKSVNNENCFKKPFHIKNAGWGIPHFISVSRLVHEGPYRKNDCITIRVEIYLD